MVHTHLSTYWAEQARHGVLITSHSTVKELLPIVNAAVIWGHSWCGHQGVSWCNNSAVVTIANSQQGEGLDAAAMLPLFLSKLISNFQMPGEHNGQADDLSHNRLSKLLFQKMFLKLTLSLLPFPLHYCSGSYTHI